MKEEIKEEIEKYKVVVNHEEQFSIWPEDRPSPSGWEEAGKRGSREECLEFIGQVWTDMRPLSLRKKMKEVGPGPAPVPSQS